MYFIGLYTAKNLNIRIFLNNYFTFWFSAERHLSHQHRSIVNDQTEESS